MFDSKTKSALNVFQASNNLTSSDIVDRDTIDALEGRNSSFCPFGQILFTTA